MSDKRCDYCGKFFRGKEKTGFVAGLSNNHGPPSNDKIISCSAGLTWPDGQAPHHALEPNQIKAHNRCCTFMRGVNQIGSQQRGRRSEGLDERPPVLPPKKLAVKSAKEKALDLRAEGELFRSQGGQIKPEEKPAAGGSAEAPEEAPEHAAADEPMEVEEGAMARGEPMLVVKGRRKGAIDPNRRLDSYLSQPKVLLRLARVRARERNDAIAALERKSEQHANARGGYPVTKLFTCHTSSTTNIPLCAEKLGESGMHMHAPQTHARHEKSTCTWCHFFSMKMADCHMHRSDRREPPGMALRRLLAPPAAPRLHMPRSRLPGRHRRRSTAAAASHAASAAARRLLPTAVREARTGARAVATGHPGGQAAASTAAHAAAIESAAFTALPAALAAASAAEAASRRLRTGHTERAETMHERPKGGSER